MSPPSAFVDTSAFVFATHDSPGGQQSRALPRRAVAGEWHAVTSTAVLEELWHLERGGRPPGLAGVTRLAYRLMTPLPAVDDSTAALALDLDDIPALGANDRIHLATCRLHGIGLIVSADVEFDDLEGLRHVDPQAEDALARLGLTPHPPGARA